MNNELEITKGLYSNSPSVRLSAANSALDADASTNLLTALEVALRNETDSEVIKILSLSVKMTKMRLSRNKNSEYTANQEDFSAFFKTLPSEQRLEMLSDMSEDLQKKIAAISFELFQHESESLIKARILSLFGFSWNSVELSEITSGLISESLSLRSATIEVLAKKAPNLLLRNLPKYLTSENIRIRLLAIMGLSAIDMDEAIIHFSALLESENTETRLSALELSFFFPFELIKPLILKFLISENDFQLIERAGLIFSINPDLEIPYRLWEIAEKSERDKKRLLQTIIKGSCKVIFDSGIIKDDFETFSLKLDNWVKQRQAAQFAQMCFQKVLDPGVPTHEVEDLIRNAIDKPFIRESFERLIQTISSEESKKRISEIISKKQLLLSFADAKSFVSLSIEEKISVLALISQKNFSEIKPFCDEIVRDLNAPFALQASVYRLALRFKIPDYCDSAIESLKRKPEPGLICSILEYLELFRADDLFLFLGRYLNSTNQRVKSSALKILKKYDLSQAVSVFRTMLLSRENEKISAALACVFNFEFCFVRDTIFEFICSTQEENFIFAGLSLYVSNPDVEGLYDLFRLEELLEPNRRDMVKTVRKQAEQILIDFGIIKDQDETKRLADFSQRWEKDREKNKKQTSDCSAVKLGVVPGKTYPKRSASFFDKIEVIIKNHWFLPAATFFLGIASLYLILAGYTSGDKPSNVNTGTNTLQIVSGIVLKADTKTIVLRDDTSTIVILSPAPKQSFNISAPCQMTAEVLPYRYTVDGRIFARVNKIIMVKP
ncbi:MAG: HEAT repeat domain-containing protein [Candidatus Riflebacteria bacterium]|nr:HEAT repeat domain-containing protein [Candidatus Riflebacteria bacterium]